MEKRYRLLRRNGVGCVTLLILCFILTACAAPLIAFGLGTAGGVVAYRYHEGQTIVVYEAPFEKTWDATLVALNQMQMRVESSSHNISIPHAQDVLMALAQKVLRCELPDGTIVQIDVPARRSPGAAVEEAHAGHAEFFPAGHVGLPRLGPD